MGVEVFEGGQVIIILQKALYLSEHGFKTFEAFGGVEEFERGIVFYIIEPKKSEGSQCLKSLKGCRYLLFYK